MTPENKNMGNDKIMEILEKLLSSKYNYTDPRVKAAKLREAHFALNTLYAQKYEKLLLTEDEMESFVTDFTWVKRGDHQKLFMTVGDKKRLVQTLHKAQELKWGKIWEKIR